MAEQAIRPAARAGLCLAGRYRLEAVVATGGMGSVWSAEDTFLGREVAVKVLTWTASLQDAGAVTAAAERVRREARAAASLRHPNVTCVYDYGHQEGLDFLVMELLDGETLAASLHRRGALEPEDAARVAAGVAGALDAAHRAGIVHRDVKPGNIMVTASGEVKLLDFGIAAISGQRSPPGPERLLGTAAYLPPEWAPDAPADPACDIYALGVVVYEMLAGRPPFTGDSLAAVAAAHAANPPPPLSLLAPGVPSPMAAVCERALAKDAATRPPSAGAFAAQLGAAISMPQPAPPPAPASRPSPRSAARPARPATAGPASPGAAAAVTQPVWAPPVAGRGARRAAGAAGPPARGHGRPRSRWQSAAVALTAALTLAAVLQSTGALQDLLGTRGTADPSPAVEAPLGGSGSTGAAPAVPGSSSQGNGNGGHGDDSSDSPDHRSSSRHEQGGAAGDGGGQRDHDDDDHSGPGSGGSS
jgi:serine/threonine-protein kinase